VARVIQIESRPIVITVAHPDCNPPGLGRSTLYLWDLAAPGANPTIYGFTLTEAK